MSNQSRITSVIQTIAGHIKTINSKHGNLSSLSTTDKTNLVNAINEINTLAISLNSQEFADMLSARLETLKSEILDGVSSAFDTLQELHDLVVANQIDTTDLNTSLVGTVRFDAAQTLSDPQQIQACMNIDILSSDQNYSVDILTDVGIMPKVYTSWNSKNVFNPSEFYKFDGTVFWS